MLSNHVLSHSAACSCPHGRVLHGRLLLFCCAAVIESDSMLVKLRLRIHNKTGTPQSGELQENLELFRGARVVLLFP
jgi:hypothetical protein